MDYFNNVTYLLLEGHVELQKYRYLYFLMALTVYVLIICFNFTVIFVIFTNHRLHKPMYIFIAALLCNAIFGACVFYPKLLVDLLSKNIIVSYHSCMTQAFFIYTYATCELTLLSAMALDRFLSICKPLQYATLVKSATVRKLIVLSWLIPCCEVGVGVLLTSQLQLCKFSLNRIYCDNYSIVKLSCKEISTNNLLGLFIFSIAVFPPVFFVVFSYVRILAVCLMNSKDFRRKALQTCLPHLIIFISFSVTSCFELINNRIESNRIPHILAMILSVENVIIPPLFNPIIYGLKMQEILNGIKRLILCKNKSAVFV